MQPEQSDGLSKDFSLTNPHLRARLHGPLRIALITVALGLALFATAGPAVAIETGTLGIRPAKEADFFHISLYPGAAINATTIVSNYTDTAVTLLIYPVDGQTSPQGAFVLASQTEPRVGIGAWVRLDAAQITVPANSDLKVPFRFSVPVGTPPGDYAGGLIIQSPPVQGEATIGGDTATRLDIVQRLGVRIYLNVEGTAVKSLKHGDLSWRKTGDTVTFTLRLHNTGNITLYPSVKLDVSGWAGVNTQLKFETPESMLPGANLNLHARLLQAPRFQAGSAEATITSEAGTGHARTSFIYVPWVLVGIGLLVLLAMLYGAWRTVRFIRRARHAIAQVTRDVPGPSVPETAALPSEPHAEPADAEPDETRDG